MVSNIHGTMCQPTQPVLQATSAVDTWPICLINPTVQRPFFLLIIPKRESLVGNNLSLLILCSWVPNQELSSITAWVCYFYFETSHDYSGGETVLASVGGGQWIYPLPFLPFWPSATFGLAFLGRWETPAQKTSSSVCCVVWLSCLRLQIRYPSTVCCEILN